MSTTMKHWVEAEGRVVPRLDGSPWPKSGLPAELSKLDYDEAQYVRRRLADGDLIETDAPPQAAETEAAPSEPVPAEAAPDADASDAPAATPKSRSKKEG